MSLVRIPITGWRRCTHDAAAFESRGEYAAAVLLDDAPDIEWWLRNDPPVFRLPTPVGFFEPDFVYLVNRRGSKVYGLLEIKGTVFWDGEGSEPRLKARAASEWVSTVNAAASSGVKWEFAIVLDDDAIASNSFDAMILRTLVSRRSD